MNSFVFIFYHMISDVSTGSLIHTFVYAVEIIEQMDGKFGSITSIEGLEVDESLNRFFNFFNKLNLIIFIYDYSIFSIYD